MKKKLIKSENENTENQVTATPEAAGTEKTEPEKTAPESSAEEKKDTKRVKEQPEAIPSEASAPKAGLGWVKTALVIFLGDSIFHRIGLQSLTVRFGLRAVLVYGSMALLVWLLGKLPQKKNMVRK